MAGVHPYCKYSPPTLDVNGKIQASFRLLVFHLESSLLEDLVSSIIKEIIPEVRCLLIPELTYPQGSSGVRPRLR